jgi:hypothetical protein
MSSTCQCGRPFAVHDAYNGRVYEPIPGGRVLCDGFRPVGRLEALTMTVPVSVELCPTYACMRDAGHPGECDPLG